MTYEDIVRINQEWLRDRGEPVVVDGKWGPLSQAAFDRQGWLSRTTSGHPKPPAPPSRNAGGLQRIIMHWTASNYSVTSSLPYYHFVIDGNGKVHLGTLKPEENISTSDGRYTPHTLAANTGSIGIAVAAMAGAQERPLVWGKYPMTDIQINAMCRQVAVLSVAYGIPVDRRTVLSHAEVQPTLGIKQRGKWDISCLPGDRSARNPITVGDELRAKIRTHITA